MNERIKELNLQAMSIVMNGNDPDGDIEQMYIPSEFTKKFAQLIVRECVGIVDNAERGGSNDVWDNAVKFIRRDLKEHFGVKK